MIATDSGKHNQQVSHNLNFNFLHFSEKNYPEKKNFGKIKILKKEKETEDLKNTLGKEK
jgi:hypothetical protein